MPEAVGRHGPVKKEENHSYNQSMQFSTVRDKVQVSFGFQQLNITRQTFPEFNAVAIW